MFRNIRFAFFFKRIFPLAQSLGFHITRNHHYEPVPDTRLLKDELWQRRSELVGIQMNETKQLEWLSVFMTSYKAEYDRFPANRQQAKQPFEYYSDNPFFGPVDGEILYCMIRHFKPARILEIGSGYSTYLAAQAVRKNTEEDPSRACELTTIDPFPNKVIKTGFPGLAKIIVSEVQDLTLSAFCSLQENDILFIDSSHVLKIGSDVQFEYLDVLPSLNPGVIVHIHDIFLPAEYPRDWILKEYRFWNEQYLLQAFLTFNEHFEVLWASSYLHLKRPDRLALAFKTYNDKNPPASFWIRKAK